MTTSHRSRSHSDIPALSFADPESVVTAVRSGFHHKRVTIVGDLMLDRYVDGTVERVSPEAPVPIVKISNEFCCAGGAANVALNLAQLGLQVFLFGVVGADVDGQRLISMLQQAGIDVRGVAALDDRITTTKTRVVSMRQQIARLDREETEPLRGEALTNLVDAASSNIETKPSVLILSDYDKGALPAAACQTLIRLAAACGVRVLVDPKGRDYEKYRGATTLTPNRSELSSAGGVAPHNLDDLVSVAACLRAQLGLEQVVSTLGEEGMLLVEASRCARIPAVPREVFNVSGAGDTATATLAAAYAVDLDLLDAVTLANLAAGIVVEKADTAPIHKDMLLDVLTDMVSRGSPPNKLCTRQDLVARIQQWRDAGNTIVFTNGCFDLLHAGHVRLLTEAKRQGDCLIVGLNSDRSVRNLKGPERPVVAGLDRARVLAGLGCVDAVTFFDDDTPIDLIVDVRPDVLVKGADYAMQLIVGAAEVRSWGGRVVLVPIDDGQSSSQIIEHVQHKRAAHEAVG